MHDDKFDQQLKQSLEKNTDEVAALKEQTWENIEKQLFNTDSKGAEKSVKKSGKRLITAISSVAAAALVVLVLNTQPGHAIIQNIKEIFLPEKVVEHNIEGQTEQRNVTLEESKTADYLIYVDEEYYKMVSENGVDKIVPKNPLPENYPAVYMQIEQFKDRSSEDLAAQLEASLEDGYQLRAAQEINEPVVGKEIRAIGGTGGQSGSDPVVKYYVIDNQLGGSFVIEQRYFLEAAEGHGARFDQMLQEFYVVSPDSK
ncbi:hypothetical protein V6C27_09595 [Peptococcaceae bacterium 1198_IL3148]